MYGHNSASTNVAFKPDGDKHESIVYFEPMSGTPLQAQSRIQLNVNAWIDRIKIDEEGATAYEENPMIDFRLTRVCFFF